MITLPTQVIIRRKILRDFLLNLHVTSQSYELEKPSVQYTEINQTLFQKTKHKIKNHPDSDGQTHFECELSVSIATSDIQRLRKSFDQNKSKHSEAWLAFPNQQTI